MDVPCSFPPSLFIENYLQSSLHSSVIPAFWLYCNERLAKCVSLSSGYLEEFINGNSLACSLLVSSFFVR